MITIRLDSHIRIPGLANSWREGLKELASVKNETKDRAERELLWGADKFPDKICFADESNDELILPRGFLSELIANIDNAGHKYRLYEDTIYEPNRELKFPEVPTFKPQQQTAIDIGYVRRQGTIIAPTGSGKTIIGLGIANKVSAPALFLVDKTNVASQWLNNAKEHFGAELGIIGDNKWQEKPQTVATVQTLWSRREELDKNNWWDKWSVVILDEQHHIPAQTYSELVSRFRAAFRIGISATLGKSKTKERISQLIFGPVIFECKQEVLKPIVNIVETEFDFAFVQTQRIGNTIQRNNYHKLLSKITRDDKRNKLIGELVARNKESANLIVSRHLEHLERLMKATIKQGFPKSRCWMLTGKETSKQRQEIYDLADSGNCAIFSTIAFEAMDIPRLDRLYLAFPIKNKESLKQVLGRITRDHPKKNDAIIYDLKDKASVLRTQFRSRLQLYQRQELKAEKILPIF